LESFLEKYEDVALNTIKDTAKQGIFEENRDKVVMNNSDSFNLATKTAIAEKLSKTIKTMDENPDIDMYSIILKRVS
jgi:hypothetical protein